MMSQWKKWMKKINIPIIVEQILQNKYVKSKTESLDICKKYAMLYNQIVWLLNEEHLFILVK